ncbi:NAD(P)/FAD-dependent oxidoreductase [Paraburkholderia sp. C35]|uniref:flavin-containing monooxygenase n=1 Tax=Paraburkholderia sp. C35 TaxID=2126993 RepID=UPI000D698596|nr:NAD(P)/FAD-dependent oxidoreductase [Paraburkholderia sp. C35]
MSKLTTGAATSGTHYDAVIIGAGFSGLGMLHHLNELGMRSRVFEAASGVGGTWFWNRYPGARTDSEFYYYSFSFSREVREEWKWSERYPAQPEVLRYLEFVAQKLDLNKDIAFNTKISRAQFDEDANLWHVTTDQGETYTARYLISGMGVLSTPSVPNIKGVQSFKGSIYQTATWPKEGVDLTGKRVGLIGVGASGVQIVPVIAPVVKDLFVFQRTPNYVVASSNYAVDDEWMTQIRANYDDIHKQATAHGFAVPFAKPSVGAKDVSAQERERVFEAGWKEGGFHFMLETFNDLATNEESNAYASDFIRQKIRETVKDPLKAELLCPKDYPFNGKRPPGGHGYYETFNRDNVHLVDIRPNGIDEITATGVRVGDQHVELDVLIFATGFDAMTGALTRIDIVGRDGLVLRDKWKDGLKTNMGLAVNGFPNFFMILGPQTPYANLPVAIQEAVGWVSRAVAFAETNGIACMESSVEAENAWAHEVHRAGSATIMAQGGAAHAWFLGANIPGKAREFNVYMGGADVYFKQCTEIAENGFVGFHEAALAPAG